MDIRYSFDEHVVIINYYFVQMIGMSVIYVVSKGHYNPVDVVVHDIDYHVSYDLVIYDFIVVTDIKIKIKVVNYRVHYVQQIHLTKGRIDDDFYYDVDVHDADSNFLVIFALIRAISKDFIAMENHNTAVKIPKVQKAYLELDLNLDHFHSN